MIHNDGFFVSVDVIEEAGFHSTMEGLSYNKNQPIDKMPGLGTKLSKHDGGHNKFLEHLIVWLRVTAPRYVWQEMDTFRLSSKNSQSTMHTILKDKLTKENFEYRDITDEYLDELNEYLEQGRLVKLKRKLPEGFLQKRMWMMSYKTLRNLILQRRGHRLPHWPAFIESVLSQVKNPEFLPPLLIGPGGNVDE